MRNAGDAHILLLELCMDIITLEYFLAESPETAHIISYYTVVAFPVAHLLESISICIKNVHSNGLVSFIHSKSKLETIQMPINRGVD